MRITFFGAWTLVAMAAGCTGPAGPGSNGAFGPHAQANPAAAPSFVDRLKAPFTGAAMPRNAAAPVQPTPPLTKDAAKSTPELYVAMAEMSQRASNIDQARSLYQKALALNPHHVGALLGAARMEDRQGQLDVALSLYQRAVQADPKNATALNDLGLCLARKGDFPSSQRVLMQAVQLDPAKALYRNNIAKVLVEMNLADQALGHLSAVHPPAVAHYNMGVLLAQRGRTAEAVRYLQIAASIDPAMTPAQQMLAELSAPPTTPVGEQRSIVKTAQRPNAPAGSPVQSPAPSPAAAASYPTTPMNPVVGEPTLTAPIQLPPVE